MVGGGSKRGGDYTVNGEVRGKDRGKEDDRRRR